jgi:hypothetical protein
MGTPYVSKRKWDPTSSYLVAVRSRGLRAARTCEEIKQFLFKCRAAVRLPKR